MSLSIGSAIQSASTSPTDEYGGAVMAKSLELVHQQGQEAIDLIETAAQPSSQGHALSVYA